VLPVELTIPFTRNTEAANARKRCRYEFLTADIEERGYKCSNIPLEIGSCGHITSRNRETLIYIYVAHLILESFTQSSKTVVNLLCLAPTQFSMPGVLNIYAKLPAILLG
jgi:hypothetical protein